MSLESLQGSEVRQIPQMCGAEWFPSKLGLLSRLSRAQATALPLPGACS